MIDPDEMLVRIVAPHFVAGIVVKDDKVIVAAHILRYMERGRWSAGRVRDYVRQKGWQAFIVPPHLHNHPGTDYSAPHGGKSGTIQEKGEAQAKA